ncbi:MAG TPA: DNA-binding protein, partial [Chloroflexota bacterium]|nr:DNA-binding protein [Chloroflexota bacterium]
SLEPIEREGPDDPLVRTAAKYTSLIATALTVNQAAALLGVNSSRIRQQLLDHTIYGIKVAHSWRLPLFQFDDDRLLPGVGEVFSRLDWSVHPVGVYNWFVNPDPDLQTDEDQAPLSPRDWLRSGRSPARVAELASALGKGL